MAFLKAILGLGLLAVAAGQIVEIEPKEAVRRIGQDLEVFCRVSYPIQYCRFESAAGVVTIVETNENEFNIGKGLKSGHCGIRLSGISESQNGFVNCTVPPQSGSKEPQGSMRLIVARAPLDPVLSSPALGSALREGESLDVSCAVNEGRPEANVSWFIDDKELYRGLHPVQSTLRPNDLVNVSQNVTVANVGPDDDGRTLYCEVSHVAWDAPRRASMQIRVHYPPRSADLAKYISIYGLQLGSEGRLNATIRASPEPEVTWTVGDQILTPPATSNDGNIQALMPIALGHGYYEVSLSINRLEKEDVERKYFLRVTNALGSEDLPVSLSTRDNPGSSLEAGAIVGIVIGVLVLVIAVSLLVLAKATDRWCFAARNRDGGKASGESSPADDVLLQGVLTQTQNSDTESAVEGKRSRFSEFTQRVRKVLPKGKDKTEAPKEQDDKPLSDEKKGVVYAELSFSEAPRDKPNPQTTEYAEIVCNKPTDAQDTKEA